METILLYFRDKAEMWFHGLPKIYLNEKFIILIYLYMSINISCKSTKRCNFYWIKSQFIILSLNFLDFSSLFSLYISIFLFLTSSIYILLSLSLSNRLPLFLKYSFFLSQFLSSSKNQSLSLSLFFYLPDLFSSLFLEIFFSFLKF